MITIGLIVGDSIATNKGDITDGYIKITEVKAKGGDVYHLRFNLYESKALFEAGNAPLQHFLETYPFVTIVIGAGEEMTATKSYQAFKVALLDADGYYKFTTVTEDTEA